MAVVILLASIYIALVVVRYTMIPAQTPTNNMVMRLSLRALINAVELPMCIAGIMTLYVLIVNYTNKLDLQLPSLISYMDKCSFGTYIYHQFILVFLYHYTPLVGCVNPWIVPWIGLTIALTTSLLLTKMTLRTKVGKYLIG